MISFLVTLLILILIVYCVQLVINMLQLPPQVKTIALIIVGIIALVYLLNSFGVLGAHRLVL